MKSIFSLVIFACLFFEQINATDIIETANTPEDNEVVSRQKRQFPNFRGPPRFPTVQGFPGFNPFGSAPQVQPGRPDKTINCNNRRNRNRPECQGEGNRPASTPNCKRRRNRNLPECLAGGSDNILAQVPWLKQLTSGKSVSLPLPKAPGAKTQSRFLLSDEQNDIPFQECITPKFEKGHCRYIQHCILPEFANSFQNFLRYVCFIEGVYIGACCPDSRYPDLTTTTTTTTTTTPRPTPPPTTSRGCGLNLKDSKRIVGGRPADPQEWPWIAALLRDGETQFCGGVLITDRHVLTAAHCVDGFNMNSLKVRLGEYTFDSEHDTAHIDFTLKRITMHAEYDRNTYVNDIALLSLSNPTTFNNDVWPVCLPPENELFVGQEATVTGWGTIYFGGPVATTLQEVTVPVWPNEECDQAYEQNIVDKFLCAGVRTGGKDSCQGDSGGPLLVKTGTQNRWAVIGVVSWGIKCAEPGNPGVYTRVNLYLDWIRDNVRFDF